jgi:hypothetical protein
MRRGGGTRALQDSGDAALAEGRERLAGGEAPVLAGTR